MDARASSIDVLRYRLLKCFPLAPADCRGSRLAAGDAVTILTVESYATALDLEAQARVRRLVGQVRRIVALDEWGFVWLSFDPARDDRDFCLLPIDLARARA